MEKTGAMNQFSQGNVADDGLIASRGKVVIPLWQSDVRDIAERCGTRQRCTVSATSGIVESTYSHLVMLSLRDFVREILRAQLKAEYLTSPKVHAALILCTFKDDVNCIRVEHISFNRYQIGHDT
jgi:hypothetical protein